METTINSRVNPPRRRPLARLARIATTLFLSACCLAHAQVTHAQIKAAETLRIYAIDVEGGQSTLLVSPRRIPAG